MKALLYGVRPESVPEPASENFLLRNLAHTPMKLVDLDEPVLPLPDWVVVRPRLTGICGSDAKQVFMDWGEVGTPDNPMKAFFSLPQVLGHEVVADVVTLGPESVGLEVGDRVVLNPWLSCAPRGVSPVCPACERGDFSLCWSFDVGPIAPGIHIGTARDANGGYAELMPAHDSQLFKVPDEVPDELAVMADPFTVSLHAVTGIRRRRAARSWCTARARSAHVRSQCSARSSRTSRCWSWPASRRRRSWRASSARP